MELDWEGAIAPVVGDIMAHVVGKNVRAGEKWLAQTIKEARRLAEEYIEEELPVAAESDQVKPVLETLGKIKQVGDKVKDHIVETVTASPFNQHK